MAKKDKAAGAPRPDARLPKGFRDIGAAELRQTQDMLATIRRVYESYGFEPLETPAIEFTDALGKFLPDLDRPNEGVFSFKDEDDQWLSLRYDLTAPLARFVAENFQDLPKPFRRYAYGPVWRNEKPGPGRFRQFVQFDADTVGADSVAADAEMCMLAADTLEALGVPRGDYVIKVNSRKVLDGIRQALQLDGPENDSQWLVAMRALDKFDRLGREAVGKLLGSGRKDESGDFTAGAGLPETAIKVLLQLLTLRLHIDSQQNLGRGTFNPQVSLTMGGGPHFIGTMTSTIAQIGGSYFESNAERDRWELKLLEDGLSEIEAIGRVLAGAGVDDGRIILDTSVIRGLEYYTGPVFEAELTFKVTGDDGQPVRFGSVGGGGRYDGLVERFLGQKVPATGFSIGVSRLQAALNALNKDKAEAASGPVVVTVMDKDRIADYQKLVQRLRKPDDGGAPIRAELYLGNPKKFGRQLEYADKRGSPCVVIQGSNEREAGEVILKDLIEGAKAAAAIKDNKEWKEARPAQVSVKEADLVAEVRKILARHTA